MGKPIVIGAVSLIVIAALAGGGIFLARRNDSPKEEPTTAGDTITLDMNEDQTTQPKGPSLDNFVPLENVDKLQSFDLKEGTGEPVQPGATITAHYTGAVAANGEIFQSSKTFGDGKPIQFSLGGVIEGWGKGVPGMKVGGVRRLVIPAEMAYGATPPAGSGIPANAALVFDIELVSVP